MFYDASSLTSSVENIAQQRIATTFGFLYENFVIS
jgi:hypothetical protein